MVCNLPFLVLPHLNRPNAGISIAHPRPQVCLPQATEGAAGKAWI